MIRYIHHEIKLMLRLLFLFQINLDSIPHYNLYHLHSYKFLQQIQDYYYAGFLDFHVMAVFTLIAIYNAYYSVAARNGGVIIPAEASMPDLYSVNPNIQNYKEAGFLSSDLIPTFTLQQVLIPYSLSEVVSSGFESKTKPQMIRAFQELSSPISIADMRQAGLNNIQDYKDAMVPVENLLLQSVFLLENVFPIYPLANIVASNYKSKSSMIIEFLELANSRTTDTVSIANLFSVGLQSAQDYKDANIPVRRLLDSSSFSPDTVFPQYILSEIVTSGFNLSTIIRKLKSIVSIADFKALNVTLVNFKAANVLVSELIPTFTLQEVSLVFSLSAIVSSGFESKTKAEIIIAFQTLTPRPSVATMIGAGLSNTQDFTDAGITVSSGFSTLATTSVALQNIITTLTSTATPTLETKALLAAEIQKTQLEVASDLTDKEKTDIVLSQVSLSTLRETFSGQRTPAIITPSAIIAANSTIDADDFQDAGFQPIEIYGLYTIEDLLNSGYTSVPLFPARSMGSKFASFNNQV